MLGMLSGMCALSGVSGWEDEVRDYIRERVMAFADQMREDALGNLLIFKEGRVKGGRPQMVCAHMDEVGLIVKGLTDEGFLRVAPVGGLDARVTLGRRVFVGPHKLPGLIGLTANHLLTDEERQTFPKFSSLLVDVGAQSRREAEEVVMPGDACVFDVEPRRIGEDFFSGRAIDDRLGCVMVMRLVMEETPAVDTWYVFTAQEEVGARGARAAAHALSPSRAVIIEATTAADLPGIPSHKQVCRLGGGVVIPSMDKAAFYDRTLVDQMIRLAEKRQISWQRKEFLAGGTDAGGILGRLSGIPCVALAAAVRYLHSPRSVVAIPDIEPMYALLRAFVVEDE